MPCHLSSRPSLAASFFFLFVKISFSSRRTALESDPINLGAGMPLLRPDCWSVGVAVTVRHFFFVWVRGGRMEHMGTIELYFVSRWGGGGKGALQNGRLLTAEPAARVFGTAAGGLEVW